MKKGLWTSLTHVNLTSDEFVSFSTSLFYFARFVRQFITVCYFGLFFQLNVPTRVGEWFHFSREPSRQIMTRIKWRKVDIQTFLRAINGLSERVANGGDKLNAHESTQWRRGHECSGLSGTLKDDVTSALLWSKWHVNDQWSLARGLHHYFNSSLTLISSHFKVFRSSQARPGPRSQSLLLMAAHNDISWLKMTKKKQITFPLKSQLAPQDRMFIYPSDRPINVSPDPQGMWINLLTRAHKFLPLVSPLSFFILYCPSLSAE